MFARVRKHMTRGVIVSRPFRIWSIQVLFFNGSEKQAFEHTVTSCCTRSCPRSILHTPLRSNSLASLVAEWISLRVKKPRITGSRPAGFFCQGVKYFFFAPSCDLGKCDPGRTRTCNLWFRRPTPYPLGHRASCCTRNARQSMHANPFSNPPSRRDLEFHVS